MVLRNLLASLLLGSVIACTAVPQQKQAAVSAPDFSKAALKEELLPPPPPVIKDTVITADPLEDVYISMDAVQQSLSNILYMIAAEAGLNLIISPDINASKPFTLTVKNMPAREALNIIAENTGIYYTIEGSSLKIQDTITKTFKIPYLHVTTDQSSVLGGNILGSDENTNLNGDFKLTYKKSGSKADLHTQLLASIKAIIFPAVMTSEISSQGSQGSSSSAQDSQPSAGSGTGAEGSSSGGSSELSYISGTEGYVFNQLTGVLKVITTPKKMKIVEDYIKEVITESKKQVLIEAKLIEVHLTDAHAYGINWQSGYNGINLMGDLLGETATPVGVIGTGNIPNLFQFIATQGRIDSLGNPRIRVMNGQSAIISSGTLKPFWERKTDTDTENNTQTITYDRVTVLDGMMLGVTPHISEDNSITINIVPIFSSIEDSDADTKQYDENGILVASYPKIVMKEAGTVLTVKSGSTIVMGGLISNKEIESERKIPFFGDIPGLGNLFKAKSKSTEKSEFVIFLTTTIING